MAAQVQHVEARSSGSPVLAFPLANAGENLLELEITRTSSLGVSTIVDSAGNTWLRAVDCKNAASINGEIWYAAKCAASTNTVTITTGEPTGQYQVSLNEWSGLSTSNPLVATSSHTVNAASTHTPGAVSPADSSALFVVLYAFNSAFQIITPPAGYTALNSTFASMQSFYKIVTSTTTENPEAVSSAAETTADMIAAFSGGAGGAVATPIVWRGGRLFGAGRF